MEKVIVLFMEDCKNLEVQCKIVHSAGAQIIEFLPIINGVAVSASKEVVQKLERHPSVRRIDTDDYVVMAL